MEATDDQPAMVERARDGDRAAWDALYRRVHPRLLAYAGRRLDPEGARDAVSETMARAVDRVDRFSWKGAGFDAWLFGILRHVVLDAHRAAGRRTMAELVDDPSSDEPALDALLRDEEVARLRAAFAGLGDGDRELLELRVIAGLSSDETAHALGKRAGAARMAQARALDRLRVLLEATA